MEHAGRGVATTHFIDLCRRGAPAPDQPALLPLPDADAAPNTSAWQRLMARAFAQARV